MPPKTPDFWSRRGLVSLMLLPFAKIYSLVGSLIRSSGKSYKSSLPVICVGGVVVGGSGKTPAVHALIAYFEKNGPYQKPVILSRGYGGTLKGPTKVDLENHSAADVGDEAILHAMRAPTVISCDRAAGARLAEAMGADVIVLDDGLQNISLHKDISFLVVDATQGFGNGYQIPAGPLREKLDNALERCTAVIESNGHSGRFYKSLPVITSSYHILSEHDRFQTYYGFAGIGVPEKFKNTLEANGFRLAGFKAFSDHHPYSEDDMDDLFEAAEGAVLITTEKDAVRIPPTYRQAIEVVCIESVFDNPDILTRIFS